MADLLLHSLSEFREIIVAILELVQPKHVVEIGSESGNFTTELITWAEQRQALVTTIDPFPADALRALSTPAHRLIENKSLRVLDELDRGDLYLVDGDHNYYTVFHELKAIDAKTRDSAAPVLVLHDVGWPCARRDQYYDPRDIPAEYLHEHTYDRGIELDDDGTVASGFRGNGQFAYATHAGGERNGVLTAIEAFVAERPAFQLFVVPAIFGLGVLVRRDHAAMPALENLLAPYHNSPVLRRIDESRLRNYLRVIALQDEAAVQETVLKSVVAHRDGVVVDRDALRAENATLRDELGALHAEFAELHERLRDTNERLSSLSGRWYSRYGKALDDKLKRPLK